MNDDYKYYVGWIAYDSNSCPKVQPACFICTDKDYEKKLYESTQGADDYCFQEVSFKEYLEF